MYLEGIVPEPVDLRARARQQCAAAPRGRMPPQFDEEFVTPHSAIRCRCLRWALAVSIMFFIGGFFNLQWQGAAASSPGTHRLARDRLRTVSPVAGPQIWGAMLIALVTAIRLSHTITLHRIVQTAIAPFPC